MTAAEMAEEAHEVANMFVLSPAMPFSEEGVKETVRRLELEPSSDTFSVLQVHELCRVVGRVEARMFKCICFRAEWWASLGTAVG